MRTRARRHPAPRLNGRHTVEGLIAQLLFWGGIVSIALVVSGLALYAAHGGFHDRVIELRRTAQSEQPAHPREVFVSLTEVARGLGAHPVRPTAVIALGLTVLLMTPVLSVAVAIPGFLADGDYRYAAIAAVVFALLALGLLLTGGIG